MPTEDVRDVELTSILVVDDDEWFRQRLARALQDRGHEVRVACDVTSAIAAARAEPPELAVVDLRMPDGSGLDVVRELHELDPSTKIVVLTGYGSIATAVEAVRLGAVHYLSKPVDADEVLRAFQSHESQQPTIPGPGDPETPSLARAEWEHIHRVLADCAGSVSEAARRLGLHRRTLQRKLQKRPPAR